MSIQRLVNVHSTFIRNNTKVETTQIPIDRWRDKMGFIDLAIYTPKFLPKENGNYVCHFVT